ncbi:MAG TPA: hypothetical protein VN151_05990 [Terracidiphilus sp.]|nr:hypothetical protein [Terracidiphilus sp.]
MRPNSSQSERRFGITAFLQTAGLLAALMFAPGRPASAQLHFGDLSTTASGNLASGYSATFSNLSNSTHNWSVGGTGTFTGAYYNPNFLTYNATVFLNQSRANSNFQSISSASGVAFASNIFGGSKFPGSVSYSKTYDSDGNYAVPGSANYVTHGNSDTFGITWAENLTDMPSLSVGYQMGSSDYTVYGSTNSGNTNFRSLNVHSGYTLAGFGLTAFFNDGNGHSVLPEVVTGTASGKVSSDNRGFGFNVIHPLPLHGSASASYNHTTWNTSYEGTNTSGTLNLVSALAALHPSQKVTVSFNTNYSDNLAGQLIETIISSGGVVTSNAKQTSNSLDVMAVATYTPTIYVQTSGYVERRTQTYESTDYGVTTYGGSASFAHRFLNGSFNSAVSAAANSSDNTGSDSLSFSVNQNYSAEAFGWHITESAGYAQNVQTLLVTYMNSFYNYSFNGRRRWGLFFVGMGASGSRTALTQTAGTGSSGQTYNATFGYGKWLTANGTYSHSSGEAIVTSAGLSGVTSPTVSSLASLYGGTGYSFGVSSTPIKKLIIGADYGRSNSNTTSSNSSSANESKQFNSLVQYQVRKLYFTSGYARLEQGFSNSGTAPEVVSSYYFGISRWFNFF